MTAPFHIQGHALEKSYTLNVDRAPGSYVNQNFVVTESQFSKLFRGTLSYDIPTLDALELDGVPELLDELELVGRSEKQDIRCDGVSVLLHQDGYGSVSVRFSIPNGWKQYATDLPSFSAEDREGVCTKLRTLLTSQISALYAELCHDSTVEAQIPYFNMTYAGKASCAKPGFATLQEDYRVLVYPDGPEPLRSSSPWDTQYFYAGYAYFFLLGDKIRGNLDKLSLLLMVLNTFYSRLSRTSISAREALKLGRSFDIEWLEQLSERLRAEYQDLATPTFSFDHHALCLRDGIFEAWDIHTLSDSAGDLVDRLRMKLESQKTRAQEKRGKWLKGGLSAITAFSLMSAVESATVLWERWF